MDWREIHVSKSPSTTLWPAKATRLHAARLVFFDTCLWSPFSLAEGGQCIKSSTVYCVASNWSSELQPAVCFTWFAKFVHLHVRRPVFFDTCLGPPSSLAGGGKRKKPPAVCRVATTWLSEHQLAVCDVPGDGNCQYHSLAIAMEPQSSAIEVRRLVQHELSAFPHLYRGFEAGTFEDYVAAQALEGTWGDHVTLQAFATACNTQVCVLCAHSGRLTTILPLRGEVSQRISLLHKPEVHYSAVLPLDHPALNAGVACKSLPRLVGPSRRFNDAKPWVQKVAGHTLAPESEVVAADWPQRNLSFLVANIESLHRNWQALLHLDSDIMCLSEIKINKTQLAEWRTAAYEAGYRCFISPSPCERANMGAGGTALFVREYVQSWEIVTPQLVKWVQLGRLTECCISFPSGLVAHLVVIYSWSDYPRHVAQAEELFTALASPCLVFSWSTTLDLW